MTTPSVDYDWRESIFPILYWDTFLDLAKWGLSISALVFASFSIESYMKLPGTHACFQHDLRNLYVTFISALIILISLNIINPYRLTILLDFIVRWLIPPTTIVLASYLVFLTHSMSTESKKQLIE